MLTGFMLARFRYERQILATLDHPNIARLLDGGTTDDDLPYFVMEYVEGVPITTYCAATKLTVRKRLELFRAVCAAVQHAHRNLVVHRDLKPSNILVTEAGVPKLLDFGIAKLLAVESSTDAVTLAKTMTAMRLMTPEYASPEQVRGDIITTATDVYALGAVLFELLTGERPHKLRDRSLAEVERAVLEASVERPSAVVARRDGSSSRLRRALAGDLDNIVLKALRKEPDRRYGSVEQLSEDIRRYLEGRPVQARNDTVFYRAGKFVQRHKAAVATAGAVTAVLVGFSITTAMQAARIARERDRANEVTEFLVEVFEVSNPEQQRGDVSARELLDKGAERVERELAGQPELQAAMMDSIGRVYRSLGLYDSARPLLERALAVRRQTLGDDHPDVADSVNTLAVLHSYQGDYEGAVKLYDEALVLRRAAYGENHQKMAETYNDVGETFRQMSRLAEAEPMHRRALEIRRRVLGPNHEDVAYSLHNLAAVVDDKGDLEAAEPLYREALALKRRVLGPEHPSVANTLNNLALLRRARNDDAEAEALHREALAIRRKALGDAHPDLAVTLNNLGSLLRGRGDLNAAESLLRESLVMKQRLLGPSHPSTAVSLQNVADVLEAKGDLAGAERYYRDALDVLTKALPATHWRLGSVRAGYGSCLTKMGRYPEAEALLLTAHDGLKASVGEKNTRTRKAVESLVALYEAWGRPDDATRYRAML